MHDTAFELGALFFATYCSDSEGDLLLDVGSMNVNGTLRECAPPGIVYLGVDLEPGPCVDLVVEDASSLPFSDGYFDKVISTSCLEHDQLFWLTFLEIARVTRPGGYIYVNCPSNGSYHAFPRDNWRFYPDAGLALALWARKNDLALTLVESFVAKRKTDQWNDCVMVFARTDPQELRVPRLMCESYGRCYNIRTFRSEQLLNYSAESEDMILLGWTGVTRPEAPPEAAPETSVGARLAGDETRLSLVQDRLDALSAAIEQFEQSLERAAG